MSAPVGAQFAKASSIADVGFFHSMGMHRVSALRTVERKGYVQVRVPQWQTSPPTYVHPGGGAAQGGGRQASCQVQAPVPSGRHS